MTAAGDAATAASTAVDGSAPPLPPVEPEPVPEEPLPGVPLEPVVPMVPEDEHLALLQQGGHHLIWYSMPWSLELYAQGEARLYRQGQKQSVIA